MEAHAAPSPGRPKACAMPLGRGCLGTHSEVKAQGVSSKNPGWLPGLWPHGGTCCTTTWQAKTVCNWVGGAWRRTQKSRCRASAQKPTAACQVCGHMEARAAPSPGRPRRCAMQLGRGAWGRTQKSRCRASAQHEDSHRQPGPPVRVDMGSGDAVLDTASAGETGAAGSIPGG